MLKDYVVEFGDKLTTFPITLIQAILDLESGKNLSSLLSMFNYLVLPWNGNFAATVNEVPLVMRNLGTLVTYKDADGLFGLNVINLVILVTLIGLILIIGRDGI